MTIEQLVSRYIASSEHVLEEMQTVERTLTVDHLSIRKVIEYVQCYLKDAKYYAEKGRFEVSLASIAYCEGLLEALRLLGAVEFEWPKTKEKEEKQ